MLAGAVLGPIFLGPTTERCPTSRVALPCLSRRPALPVASPCLLSRRSACCRVALLAVGPPCPVSHVALLAVASPCWPHAALLPARRPALPALSRPAARTALLPAPPCCAPPCCSRRPAAARPAARSPAGRRPSACAPPCWQPHRCLHRPARDALLPTGRSSAARAPPCWQPHRCPHSPARAALRLPALLCAALLAAALPCPGCAPLFPSSSLAHPATADSATRSQWLTHDAADRLAVRNHLPLAERAHFGQHKTAKALYDAVVARYSSPATAALGRLILPYVFPELSAFAIVEDLVTHLRTSDARYRSSLPTEFLDRTPPPPQFRDHFLALEPTYLTVDLLEKNLLAGETSVVAVGAARGTPRTALFEGCSPSPLAPSYASAAAIDILRTEDVRTASALSGKRRSSKGKGGKSGGGGNGGGGGGGSGSSGSGGGGGGFGGGGGGGSGSGGGGIGGGRGGAAQRGGSGGGQRQQ
ncbi:unnamed protein product [Closterium sp. NIES-54]